LVQLTKSHIKNQQYWVIALKLQLQQASNPQQEAVKSQAKRIRQKVNLKLPSRTKLVITAVEMQIQCH
jgi:hypothetical protein